MWTRRRYGSTTNEEAESLLDTAYCDHYSHDDDEDENVVGSNNNDPRRKKKTTSSTTSNKNSSCIKTLANVILLPLLVLTIISLYYSYQLQHEVTNLSVQLTKATTNIDKLTSTITQHTTELSNINTTLTNHSSVISRFANSVSNNDVLEKLDQLEVESKEREEFVSQEMERTKREIRSVLNVTKMEIDETVR